MIFSYGNAFLQINRTPSNFMPWQSFIYLEKAKSIRKVRMDKKYIGFFTLFTQKYFV